MVNSTEPVKVSVCMITYNHEKFITQAIESVVMQKTDFRYELVVGEDFSKDRTREIVLKYRDLYPDKIRLLLHESNLGAGGKRNLVQTIQACRGSYIALLEGDDYWTSPGKLQKQFDYLEKNRRYAACFHNVDVLYEDDERQGHSFHRMPLKGSFSLPEIISDFFIPTCSTMFRARLFPEFPDWYYSLFCGDWPLHILNAEHGDYGYIDEILGVYRVHAGGFLSGKNKDKGEVYKKTIATMETINRGLNFRYDQRMKEQISLYHFKLADFLVCQNRLDEAMEHIKSTWVSSPFNRKISNVMFLKVVARITCPRAYRMIKAAWDRMKFSRHA